MPAAPAEDLAALLERYPFRIGERVPGTPYRVMELVGAGGMGCVYEVEHVTLGKRFVLKSLIGGRPELGERLRNEWRALAQLESPHIVAVTDAGACSTGAPYFVMERLEGETLRAFMRRRGAVPPTVALRMAAEMLAGLGAAHAVGIIHRDVKPANVFVTLTGQIKLLDFGVAKVAFGAQGLTAEGMAVGTPRYMAPEQARGGAVDGRTDVYAVGLILFELLTGERPFDDRQGVMGRLGAAPPSLRSIVPELPAALDSLVARLLARDPRRRPVTALAARQALIEVAAGLPLGAGDEVSGQRARLSDRCPPLVEQLLAAQGDPPNVAQEAPSEATRVDGAPERAVHGGYTVRLTNHGHRANEGRAAAGGSPASPSEARLDVTREEPNDTFPEPAAFDATRAGPVPRVTLEPPTPEPAGHAPLRSSHPSLPSPSVARASSMAAPRAAPSASLRAALVAHWRTTNGRPFIVLGMTLGIGLAAGLGVWLGSW
ncbi:MAG: serine/threonine protein kinase [Polyangiaceae bacterium]|nr:serine/threonine protein kinase [Polyangiaceae bacterium]MCW5791015.1 serine/threonine protein kinase [Polyangiaceae bacterium]